MQTPSWAIKKIKAALEGATHLNLNRFQGTELEVFPMEVLELEQLEILDLSAQPIIELPKEISRLKNLKHLNLDRASLTTLPRELINIPSLTELYIGGNSIVTLPEWLGERTSWTELGLGGLKLNEVPEWISKQSNLRKLDLAANRLERMPGWLGGLDQLTSLRISANPFKVWPEEINGLTQLEELLLALAGLAQVPASISSLQNLTRLYLMGNSLSDLPSEFATLQNLKNLNLRNNCFEHIPTCIFLLASLEYLNFRNKDRPEILYGKPSGSLNRNKINEIPEEITNLIHLQHFDIAGNPISKIPLETVSRGIEAIRSYYKQLREHKDFIFEVKVLIVGEPHVGKTTLAHKLHDSSYKLSRQPDSTQGVDITHLIFQHSGKPDFRINLWDFAGQAIYHTPHQFFLTRNSLYLLVVDPQKEKTDFELWLQLIELYGGDSPILIIKNEKQDEPIILDELKLRGRFGSLKEVIPANFDTNRGLEEIHDAIDYQIRKLRDAGTPLPKSWVLIRNELENLSKEKPYIYLGEYLKICEKHGVIGHSDVRAASHNLHDFGVCLHFQDSNVLNNIIILNNKWATDGAYRVLDSALVKSQNGHFCDADLEQIWWEPEYAGMQQELVSLMQKFHLCYEIPDETGHYVVPELLKPNAPCYEWDEGDNLHLWYRYDFMPRGILTRLQVHAHDKIANQELVWRTGAVFHDPDYEAKAEVIEFYEQREIRIRISGIQKTSLRAIIERDLGTIHNKIPNLKYKVYIPCHCQICKEASKPHLFEKGLLNRYYNNRGFLIQCPESSLMVDVRTLIEDPRIEEIRNEKVAESELEERDTTKLSAQGQVTLYINNNPTISITNNPSFNNTNQVNNTNQNSNTNQAQNHVQGELSETEIKRPASEGSPLVTILFILACFLIIFAVIGRAASLFPLTTVWAIVTFALLSFLTVSAVVLFYQDKLKEKGFIEVIKLILGQIPVLGKLFTPNQKE